MKTLRFDPTKAEGAFKILNATNGGPWHKRHATDQWRSNFADYKAARIPYSRNHDSAVHGIYGGPYSHDITNIFPDFSADENDPASYDFPITDNYMKNIVACGSKVFYRLGSKIEHEVKKYNTLPPKDFKKWAEICEHIIAHYTEGWADGFHYDIEYWEIWNEPDLDPDDSTNKRTWGGTTEEFYDFYEIVAVHLKKRFPHLKIGGPASAGDVNWLEGFFKRLTAREERIPLDFFSWHVYCSTPEKVFELSAHRRDILDRYGYTETESILNEWNYVKDWQQFSYSVKQIISIKGAAFTAACMCASQYDRGVDMLMYYDARPSAYNGLFDFYTNEPLKGYYPFKMFNELYLLGTAVKCTSEGDGIYAVAAKGDDKSAVMITYFTDDDECTEKKDIILDFSYGAEEYEMLLLDSEKNAESVGKVKAGEKITLLPNTVCLIKS